MELSASQLYFLCTPVGAFMPVESILRGHDDPNEAADSNTSPEAWAGSFTNPSLRINTLGWRERWRWRIDSADAQGTQLFATPLFVESLAPLRIDVFIPNQDQYPRHLRPALDPGWGFCIRDSRVNYLGYARLVLQALENWTTEVGEDFIRDKYTTAPFGSRVIVESIRADPTKMKVRFVPDRESERQMLSISALQALWDLPADAWPPVVNMSELKLVRQLHDTISVVHLPERYGSGKVVFKSAVRELKFLYHELKLLLSMPNHPHIMPKPLYLVMMKDRYGGDDKLCGFILPFFNNGNLADAMSNRKDAGTLNLKDQFRWARQVAETLTAVNQGPARYYSELKADNLLLDDEDNIIFIDFEQRGNWITYSAPEIHYIEYVQRLAKSSVLSDQDREHYSQILTNHIPAVEEYGSIYDNPPLGYYTVWKNISEKDREVAEVYSLGKVLWCIFEGCADTRDSVLKAFKWDTRQEYPEFRRTPPRIQELILACTAGSPYLKVNNTEIVRGDGKFYPRGRTGHNGEPTATAQEAVEACQEMWRARMKDVEEFLDAKLRWQRSGVASEKEEQLLGFMRRPTLEEAIDTLRKEEARLSK